MFAASTQSNVFHLLQPNHERTLCGLRVSSLTRLKRGYDRLHLIRSQPTGYSECKHCLRMKIPADQESDESLSG